MTNSSLQDFHSQKRVIVNEKVRIRYQDLFTATPILIQSPGRINLIGEHTDYNNGYVLPTAIDKGIQFAMGYALNTVSTIYSLKYDQFLHIDHQNLTKISGHSWGNYFLGILHQLKDRGLDFEPFNCVFDGDLPTGAGLSSSAAMECGFVFGINELNTFQLERLEMIHMAQWSEHNYVGVNCGIMDQFTSMMGKQDHVILLDCQSLAYTYHDFNLDEYELVLCDSNVKHSLASSEYNTRRKECEEGLRQIKEHFKEVRSFRDVSEKMVREMEGVLPKNIFNRSLYIVQENDRVIEGVDDLKSGRLEAFGKRMFKTHEGLSVLYEVSCPELDFLVDEARHCKGVIGARMMGGGFGGCSLNIVEKNHMEEFLTKIKTAYKVSFNKSLTTHIVNSANGTSVIHNY